MTVEEGERDSGEPIEILLIEPNPGDTRLFTESFKDAQITNRIYAVSDGETALDFVHQRGEYARMSCPDIVLLDPQLPDTSGADVLSELSADPVLSDIPVVILTSSGAEEEIAKSHDLEADAYIQKPVEPEEFVDFIGSIEEFWFTIVRRPSEETE